MLAAFLVLIFLTPFDSTEMPFSVGVDARADRFLVLAIVGFWIASLAAAGPARPVFRPTLLHGAVGLFFSAAILSVVLDLSVLNNQFELGLSLKKLTLLVSYISVFLVVASTLRVRELRAFATLVVGLACLTSLGIVYEYRTGINVFYEWSDKLLPGGFTVLPEPADPDVGASTVVGPAQHGLAATALLSMALPFAIVGILRSEPFGRKLVAAGATGLIFAGIVATQRKSSVLVPAAVVLALIAMRPRQMLRLAPLGIVLVLLVQTLTPGALGTIKARFLSARHGDATTTGRTRDYDAVKPDIAAHLLTGRGYESYDPGRHRILDNGYLGFLVEIGVIGTASFLFVLVAFAITGLRVIRVGDPVRGPPAIASVSGAAGFAVATALFDIISFPQAPYIFFFIGGLVAVACVASAQPVELGLNRPAHRLRGLTRQPAQAGGDTGGAMVWPR